MPLDVLAQIRDDLPLLGLGVILIVVGLGASAVAAFQWRPNGRLLLGFGAFTAIYGLRIFAWAPSGRTLFGGPERLWYYLDALSTYAVPVPAAIFFVEFFGRGYRGLLVWAYRILLGYGLAAIVWSVVSGDPFAAMGPYRPIVILANAVIAGHLVFPRRPVDHELRVLRATFLVFIALAFNATLIGAGVLPWTWSAEPLGFAIFMGGIGYVAARRVIRDQTRLAELARELETARAVQRVVLPRELPALAGLGLAARYLPAAEVAGDFYDFLVLDERRLTVLVADVSGHGVPAALIASMVKVAFAAQIDVASRPDDVLTGINRILCGNLKGNFVTAACAHVDLDRRRLVYATAGHPPLLLRREAGAPVEQLTTAGIFLGVFPDARCRRAEFALEPGDTVVAYTDGILEAAPLSGELFGMERLVSLVESGRGYGPDELAGAVLDAVSFWHHGPDRERSLDDDVTLVVFELNR